MHYDSLRQQLPDTPAGRASAFALANIATAGRGLDPVGVDEHYGPAPTPDARAQRLQHLAGRYATGYRSLGSDFRISEAIAEGPGAVHARIAGTDGREWQWTLCVSDGPTPAVTDVSLAAAPPSGSTVRRARPDDADQLRQICRRAPLRLSDRRVAIDPGPDYFAGLRLMGNEVDCYVAEIDGHPAAVECGVSQPVRIAGNDVRLYLVAHSRVLPEHAGTQVWRALHTALSNRHYRIGTYNASSIAYVRPDNRAAQRIAGIQAKWSVQPYRVVISCRDQALGASAASARRATSTDAPHVARLINAAHGNEELFVPYTPGSLSERLGRDSTYGWHDILVNDHAAVGVWDAGGSYITTDLDGTNQQHKRRAAVLDYGWDPDHPDALVGLLRAWCGELAQAGIDELGIFTSEPSPSAMLLGPLGATTEVYDLATPYLREPPGAARNGVHVDPIYF